MGLEYDERQHLTVPARALAPVPAHAHELAHTIGNRAFARLLSVAGPRGHLGSGNRAVAARVARASVARAASDDSLGAGIRADGTVDQRIESMIDARRGAGSPLAPAIRGRLEDGLDAGLSDVRVHADASAATLASSVAARAFTVGSDIFFGSDQYRPDTPQGDDLIAHEIVHTIQQRGAPSAGPLRVTEPGDVCEREADETGRSVARGPGGAQPRSASGPPPEERRASRRTLARSEPGEHVQFGTSDRIVTLGSGAEVKERHLIAMGDFFKSPEALFSAPKTEIEALVKLIEQDEHARSGKGGENPSEKAWQDWSLSRPEGERYMDLNKANEAHFADLNKQRWAELHTKAIKAAWRLRSGAGGGVADFARATNGMASHFLTDAFSAGHQVNKVRLKAAAKKMLNSESRARLAAAIARGMWNDSKVGAVMRTMEIKAGALSKFRPGGWAPASEARIAELLASVMYWKEDDFLSIFVKAAHDDLNQAIGRGEGPWVANAHGDRWQLPGDTTLRLDNSGQMVCEPVGSSHAASRTLEVGQAAVKAAEDNLAAAITVKYEEDLDDQIPAMLEKVWAYVPMPTSVAGPGEHMAGRAQVDRVFATYSDPDEAQTVTRIVGLSISEFDTARDELINAGLMRPPPTAEELRRQQEIRNAASMQPAMKF